MFKNKEVGVKQPKIHNTITLRASIASWNQNKKADHASDFHFYMSYLQEKKAQGEYLAMKLAKENREWILRKHKLWQRKRLTTDEKLQKRNAWLANKELDEQLAMRIAYAE